MKTFEDFSRKNIEIDPYGEEDDWDVFIVDWNKIKIVRPSPSDIGKNVLITPDSRYYSPEMISTNPCDTKGVITEYRRDSLPFQVSWSNGHYNSYKSIDLTLINESINENYFSDVNDYYKIFGFKKLLTKYFIDQSNLKRSSRHLVRYNQLDNSEVLKIIKDVVDFYYDEKDIKFIGRGAYGSVYETSDKSKVLKLTTDAKEVKRAEKFRKINTKCVVDYYDIRQIKIFRDGEEMNMKLWAMILEKVEPLNKIEKSIWKVFSGIILGGVFYGFTDNDYREGNKFFINGELDPNLPSDVYKICEKFSDLLSKTIKLSNKYHISFEDLHEDNMGKTINGEYKFFDVRSTGYANPKLSLKPININL